MIPVLQEAQGVLANEEASQSEVDKVYIELVTAFLNLRFKSVEEVDKTELEELIKEAESYKEEEYTPGTWDVFQEALDAAKEVAANENATEAEVEKAVNDLQEAINALTKKADKGFLEELISEVEGYNEEDYTAGSWAALQKALEAAKEVVANEDATETEVMDAYNNLRDAIDNLVDKSWLQKLYDAIEESDKSKYTPASLEGLTEAMENAKAVLDDPDVTQEEVDNAYNELARAWLNLRLKADKELLQGLYDKVSGIDIERYTEASAERFIEAAAKAKEVLEDPNVNQEGVDNAYNELLKAYLDLRLIPNKELLTGTLTKAMALNKVNYSAKTWGKVEEAVNEAQVVLNDPEAVQSEVDRVNDALTKAIEGLETVKASDSITSIKTGDSKVINHWGAMMLFTGAIMILKRKKVNK